MKKTLLPPVKTPADKCCSSWVVSQFPDDYQSLNYVELFTQGGVLLNKERSQLEAINFTDTGLLALYRAVRDEPAVLIKQLRGVRHSERSCSAILSSEGSGHLDMAVKEFVRRTAYRGDKFYRGADWSGAIKRLGPVAARFKGVFLLNKPPTDIVKIFNDAEMFVYVDLPDAYPPAACIELARGLNVFKGRVAIRTGQSLLYERLFKGWKTVKRRGVNPETIWQNY